MTTIAEVRAKYPQYSDMSDAALAEALHTKFYADIPKTDFFTKIGLTSAPDIIGQIPGTRREAPPETQRSVADYVRGVAEVPAIVAGQIGAGIAAPVAAMYGELTSPAKQGTPEARAAGEAMAAKARAQFYQPRTEVGPEIVGRAAKFAEPLVGALPPTMGSLGAVAQTASAPAINVLAAQAVPAIARAAAPVRNALVRTPTQQPMVGGGAATTREELMRSERSARTGVPLTKGELQQDLQQQQFESDISKKEAGKPLVAFKEQQQAAIKNRFQQMANETGAQYADPQGYLNVGKVVDKAIVNLYEKKIKGVDDAYNAARASGETKELVPYQQITDYIAQQDPTTRKTLAPILSAVEDQLKMNDPQGTGQISIDGMDSIYKAINKLSQPGTPNAAYGKELKTLINASTEGAGGDLYRKARTLREQVGKEFDDAYRVSKLLGTKAGYADRAVALDDVFKFTVLEGSKDELRTVGLLLKKGGEEGRQAWAELQGQTIQHLKDIATKGDTQDVQFNQLRNTINALDKEGKLEYLFGKKGRDEVLDLRDVIQDALVKKPGAVNYSNTATFAERTLDKLAALRVPLAKAGAEALEQRANVKKVEEAIKYNALAPNPPRIILNNMAPDKK
jgi:hypothetical protein